MQCWFSNPIHASAVVCRSPSFENSPLISYSYPEVSYTGKDVSMWLQSCIYHFQVPQFICFSELQSLFCLMLHLSALASDCLFQLGFYILLETLIFSMLSGKIKCFRPILYIFWHRSKSPISYSFGERSQSKFSMCLLSIMILKCL